MRGKLSNTLRVEQAQAFIGNGGMEEYDRRVE